jgi:uncharacterized membrane protein
MNEQLRIGDAERERAAADLGEHFAQGRLTVDEHAERVERVWSARTHADLEPLFKDLPGGEYGVRPVARPTSPTRAWVPSGPRRDRTWPPGRFRGFPGPLFVVLMVLAAILVVTHLPLILVALVVWLLFFKHRAWHRRW